MYFYLGIKLKLGYQLNIFSQGNLEIVHTHAEAQNEQLTLTGGCHTQFLMVTPNKTDAKVSSANPYRQTYLECCPGVGCHC
jgi:hypothetical protein